MNKGLLDGECRKEHFIHEGHIGFGEWQVIWGSWNENMIFK